MKTPFDPLVISQKRKLDICELQIVRCNNKIAAKQSELNAIIAQISEIEIPQSADFGVFLQINAVKKTYLYEIDTLRAQISHLKNEIKTLQNEHKNISIEFEKMKHIQEKEKEKLIKIMRQKESRNLDEIAIMLYKKERV